ncbi:conserved Plasmodium protein, unknown function [Plasmodium vinckei lentum]|uniref:Uncharacterized protein n=1 Tax=Plasmodium vinckei lentum TaxID=138297 RepID=A0A6V7S7F5_PLAVN|nr:conserved Plasmodium protein, unknown function [Plasmodium vinckei lentum]
MMDNEYHEPTNKEKETILLNNSDYTKSCDNKTTQIKNLRNDENQSSQNIKEGEWKKDKGDTEDKWNHKMDDINKRQEFETNGTTLKNGGINFYSSITDRISKLKTIIKHKKKSNAADIQETKKQNEEAKKDDSNNVQNESLLYSNKTKCDNNMKNNSNSENKKKYKNKKEIELLKNIAKRNSLKKIEKNINLLLVSEDDDGDSIDNNSVSEDLKKNNGTKNISNIQNENSTMGSSYHANIEKSEERKRLLKKMIENFEAPYNSADYSETAIHTKLGNKNINNSNNNNGYEHETNRGENSDLLHNDDFDISLVSSDSLKQDFSIYSFNGTNNSNNKYFPNSIDNMNISKISGFSKFKDLETQGNNTFTDSFNCNSNNNINNSFSKYIQANNKNEKGKIYPNIDNIQESHYIKNINNAEGESSLSQKEKRKFIDNSNTDDCNNSFQIYMNNSGIINKNKNSIINNTIERNFNLSNMNAEHFENSVNSQLDNKYMDYPNYKNYIDSMSEEYEKGSLKSYMSSENKHNNNNNNISSMSTFNNSRLDIASFSSSLDGRITKLPNDIENGKFINKIHNNMGDNIKGNRLLGVESHLSMSPFFYANSENIENAEIFDQSNKKRQNKVETIMKNKTSNDILNAMNRENTRTLSNSKGMPLKSYGRREELDEKESVLNDEDRKISLQDKESKIVSNLENNEKFDNHHNEYEIDQTNINEICKKINSISMLNDLSLTKLESLNSSILEANTKYNGHDNFLDDVILNDSIFNHSNMISKDNKELKELDISDSLKHNFFHSMNKSEEDNIFKISKSYLESSLNASKKDILNMNVSKIREKYERHQNKMNNWGMSLNNSDNIIINNSDSISNGKSNILNINKNEISDNNSTNFYDEEKKMFTSESIDKRGLIDQTQINNITKHLYDIKKEEKENYNNINDLQSNKSIVSSKFSYKLDTDVLLKDSANFEKIDYINSLRKSNTDIIGYINKFVGSKYVGGENETIQSNTQIKEDTKIEDRNIPILNDSRNEDNIKNYSMFYGNKGNNNKINEDKLRKKESELLNCITSDIYNERKIYENELCVNKDELILNEKIFRDKKLEFRKSFEDENIPFKNSNHSNDIHNDEETKWTNYSELDSEEYFKKNKTDASTNSMSDPIINNMKWEEDMDIGAAGDNITIFGKNNSFKGANFSNKDYNTNHGEIKNVKDDNEKNIDRGIKSKNELNITTRQAPKKENEKREMNETSEVDIIDQRDFMNPNSKSMYGREANISSDMTEGHIAKINSKICENDKISQNTAYEESKKLLNNYDEIVRNRNDVNENTFNIFKNNTKLEYNNYNSDTGFSDTGTNKSYISTTMKFPNAISEKDEKKKNKRKRSFDNSTTLDEKENMNIIKSSFDQVEHEANNFTEYQIMEICNDSKNGENSSHNGKGGNNTSRNSICNASYKSNDIKHSNITNMSDVLNLNDNKNTKILFFDNINNSSEYYDIPKPIHSSIFDDESNRHKEDAINNKHYDQAYQNNHIETIPLNDVKGLIINSNFNDNYIFPSKSLKNHTGTLADPQNTTNTIDAANNDLATNMNSPNEGFNNEEFENGNRKIIKNRSLKLATENNNFDIEKGINNIAGDNNIHNNANRNDQAYESENLNSANRNEQKLQQQNVLINKEENPIPNKQLIEEGVNVRSLTDVRDQKEYRQKISAEKDSTIFLPNYEHEIRNKCINKGVPKIPEKSNEIQKENIELYNNNFKSVNKDNKIIPYTHIYNEKIRIKNNNPNLVSENLNEYPYDNKNFIFGQEIYNDHVIKNGKKNEQANSFISIKENNGKEFHTNIKSRDNIYVYANLNNSKYNSELCNTSGDMKYGNYNDIDPQNYNKKDSTYKNRNKFDDKILNKVNRTTDISEHIYIDDAIISALELNNGRIIKRSNTCNEHSKSFKNDHIKNEVNNIVRHPNFRTNNEYMDRHEYQYEMKYKNLNIAYPHIHNNMSDIIIHDSQNDDKNKITNLESHCNYRQNCECKHNYYNGELKNNEYNKKEKKDMSTMTNPIYDNMKQYNNENIEKQNAQNMKNNKRDYNVSNVNDANFLAYQNSNQNYVKPKSVYNEIPHYVIKNGGQDGSEHYINNNDIYTDLRDINNLLDANLINQNDIDRYMSYERVKNQRSEPNNFDGIDNNPYYDKNGNVSNLIKGCKNNTHNEKQHSFCLANYDLEKNVYEGEISRKGTICNEMPNHFMKTNMQNGEYIEKMKCDHHTNYINNVNNKIENSENTYYKKSQNYNNNINNNYNVYKKVPYSYYYNESNAVECKKLPPKMMNNPNQNCDQGYPKKIGTDCFNCNHDNNSTCQCASSNYILEENKIYTGHFDNNFCSSGDHRNYYGIENNLYYDEEYISQENGKIIKTQRNPYNNKDQYFNNSVHNQNSHNADNTPNSRYFREHTQYSENENNENFMKPPQMKYNNFNNDKCDIKNNHDNNKLNNDHKFYEQNNSPQQKCSTCACHTRGNYNGEMEILEYNNGNRQNTSDNNNKIENNPYIPNGKIYKNNSSNINYDQINTKKLHKTNSSNHHLKKTNTNSIIQFDGNKINNSEAYGYEKNLEINDQIMTNDKISIGEKETNIVHTDNNTNKNDKVNENDTDNSDANKIYSLFREKLGDLGAGQNGQVLSQLMDVMINIQNDLKDVKSKLLIKKINEIENNMKNENTLGNDQNKEQQNDQTNVKTNEMVEDKESEQMTEQSNDDDIFTLKKVEMAINEMHRSISSKNINNQNTECKKKEEKEVRINPQLIDFEKNNNVDTYSRNKPIRSSSRTSNINRDRDVIVKKEGNDRDAKKKDGKENKRNEIIINKQFSSNTNVVLKNLNYEYIEDSTVSKSNRLYLFNKFFTSLFYEENTKMHNCIMFNIYNIEQKRQTHKVTLFSEKDYYDIFNLAYNNLLFYAFDCYKFFRYIKYKFRDTYKIYENSTICLYINNCYETNLIKRIFIEQNYIADSVHRSNTQDNSERTKNRDSKKCESKIDSIKKQPVSYTLNEKRILKTSTKYFLDNFLSHINKQINIKNIIPLMKKENYEFDQTNLYFFISNFNLMDKVFSDSHGFDCNKKFFEKNASNTKNYAIFFKFVHEATKFFDTFIDDRCNSNKRHNNREEEVYANDRLTSHANNSDENYNKNNGNNQLSNRGCYRLIIVALHKGKTFKYENFPFHNFMKYKNNEIYNYYNNYDSIYFNNGTVILFDLSYAVPFYYIEYYKN